MYFDSPKSAFEGRLVGHPGDLLIDHGIRFGRVEETGENYRIHFGPEDGEEMERAKDIFTDCGFEFK